MISIRIEKSVAVITPSIALPYLRQCIDSVTNQTYKNLKHIIVADGPEYLGAVKGKAKLGLDDFASITCTPENTGRGGYYGHRIYAAYPHLIEADYIAFLDEDNWYEPNHIESLVEKLEKNNHDWVYSLRNVYSNEQFLAADCCEAIGKWPIYFWPPDNPQHLVDTSTYLFKRDFLINVCQHWNFGWGGDRRFYQIISKLMGHTNYDTTGLHTLNYRVDINKAYGGDFSFFDRGNKVVLERYGGKYPWN